MEDIPIFYQDTPLPLPLPSSILYLPDSDCDWVVNCLYLSAICIGRMPLKAQAPVIICNNNWKVVINYIKGDKLMLACMYLWPNGSVSVTVYLYLRLSNSSSQLGARPSRLGHYPRAAKGCSGSSFP